MYRAYFSILLLYLCGKVQKYTKAYYTYIDSITDSKVHEANMGPTWVLSAPDEPHVGPMNLAIGDFTHMVYSVFTQYVQ